MLEVVVVGSDSLVASESLVSARKGKDSRPRPWQLDKLARGRWFWVKILGIKISCWKWDNKSMKKEKKWKKIIRRGIIVIRGRTAWTEIWRDLLLWQLAANGSAELGVVFLPLPPSLLSGRGWVFTVQWCVRFFAFWGGGLVWDTSWWPEVLVERGGKLSRKLYNNFLRFRVLLLVPFSGCVINCFHQSLGPLLVVCHMVRKDHSLAGPN